MREKESGVPCFHQFHYKQLNVGGGEISWTSGREGRIYRRLLKDILHNK